jgi:hypothetical protein
VQCSDRELISALRGLDAFEHRNHWLVLHEDLLADVLDALVTYARAQGYEDELREISIIIFIR